MKMVGSTKELVCSWIMKAGTAIGETTYNFLPVGYQAVFLFNSWVLKSVFEHTLFTKTIKFLVVGVLENAES